MALSRLTLKSLNLKKPFLGERRAQSQFEYSSESLLSLRAEIVTAGFSTFTVQLQQEVSKEGKI